MARLIAIANQKGGVGKTTTTVNLSAAMASKGVKVLVLDMDPQGNSSSGLGVDSKAAEKGIYEVLIGQASLAEAIHQTVVPGVEIVPSGQRLIGAEVELVDIPNREHVLKSKTRKIRQDYDYILADCPPSLGLLTINTLTAADSVLIPIQTEYYALEGLTQLLGAIQLVKESLNADLEIEGILLTMYDARLNLSQQVAEEARKYFEGRVYASVIPRNVRLSEAPSFGMPIIQYDRASSGSRSYLALAEEVMASQNQPKPDRTPEPEVVTHE